MAITPSELRQNIYRLLDQVIETGVPLEIQKGDARLRLSVDQPPSKLENLPIRSLYTCDPDELVVPALLHAAGGAAR